MIQTAVQRPLIGRPGPPVSLAGTREIPFDHAFRYKLTGVPGNVINSTLTVSIESSFTAVSIGYGVVPKVQPIIFGLNQPAARRATLFSVTTASAPPTRLDQINLGQIMLALNDHLIATETSLRGETSAEAVLRNGIKLNPDIAELALTGLGTANLPADVLERLFQVVASPSELIQFKYAIFDEGSGREFQSEPILNIAGLGSAKGERPFRYFAKPITFSPRSTVRLEITEVSDFVGELHITLHGFKVLGGAGGESQARGARRRRR